MGRAKRRLELVRSEKARNLTFRKRKEGLKKKAHELRTLCDVEVSLIIYGPTHSTANAPAAREREIWPVNPDNVQRLIDSYRNQSSKDQDRRNDNLSNFFKKKRQNIESNLLELRKQNEMAKCPIEWDGCYNSLSEEQLRDCASLVEAKLEYAKNRIEIMKGFQCCYSSAHIMNGFALQQQQPQQPVSTWFNPSEIVLPGHCYPFDQAPQVGDQFDDEHLVPNPLMMMMLMMNGSGSDCYYNTPTVVDASRFGNCSTHPTGFYSYDDHSSYLDAPLMAPPFQYPKMETGGVHYSFHN